MVTPRRGTSKLGCLFGLLVLAAVAYFGINIGEVFWRYYRYEDGFKQQARFASQASDEQIRRRLASLADSLGLPEEAGRISIARSANGVRISAQYEEVVELPLFVRTFVFRPSVTEGQ
jgi:hypothetical protein